MKTSEKNKELTDKDIEIITIALRIYVQVNNSKVARDNQDMVMSKLNFGKHNEI